MIYRCPHADCNGLDFIEIRPLYRYGKDWRGRTKRMRSGSQIMCTVCLGHSSATDEGLAVLLRPQSPPPNPQADDSLAVNGARRSPVRFADLGREP